MRNAYRMFAGLYCEVSHGMSVLTPDYRVAPEHPYPAALEDAYAAYCYLLEQGWFSEQIIIAGDSAGGGLAMALCHYLKDHGKQLPCGIVAMLTRGQTLRRAGKSTRQTLSATRYLEKQGTALFIIKIILGITTRIMLIFRLYMGISGDFRRC